MKKVLIGCGIVALLFIVVLAAVGIFAGVKVANYGKSVETASQSMATVDRDFAFVEPAADSAMPADRFQAYLGLRQRFVDRVLQVPFISKLVASSKNAPPALTPGDILGLVGEFPKLMQFYADELRAAKMSSDEFQWLSERTIEAIHTAGKNGDAEYAAAWDKIQAVSGDMQTAMRNSGNTDPNVQAMMMKFDTTLMKASMVEADPASVQLVLDAKEQLAANPVQLAVEMLALLFLQQMTP